MKKRLSFLLALLIVSATAWAQHGPRILACEGCPVSATEKPYPRTGMWFDPARSGSGINLEVQNGFAFGLYYGFDDQGEPVWYSFTGPLEPADEDDQGYWTLTSELMEITGGNCIDCPYQPPEATGSLGEFRLTVLQHNLISYTLDDGETYRMQPLVWGTPMATVFPEIVDHPLPLIPRDERVSPWASDTGNVPWLLIARTPDDSDEGYLQSLVILWGGSGLHSHQQIFSMLFIRYFPYSSELQLPITMECARPSEERAHGTVPQEILETLGPDPVCIVNRAVGVGRFQHYIAPLGDVGDGYFFATAQDGSSIEGYRLLYR